MLETAGACWSVCYCCKHLRPEVNFVRTGLREKSVYLYITKSIWQHNSMRRRIIILCQTSWIISKKDFIKNTLFYKLHAHCIHIKSHIVHHTIYKFGEKEDRYKKSRYPRTQQPREKLSVLAGMLPRVTYVVVTTMQCAY